MNYTCYHASFGCHAGFESWARELKDSLNPSDTLGELESSFFAGNLRVMREDVDFDQAMSYQIAAAKNLPFIRLGDFK